MESCPDCSSDDLIRIDLAPRGRKVHFNTCRACEHKWWTDAEVAVQITLDDVLQEVSAA